MILYIFKYLCIDILFILGSIILQVLKPKVFCVYI